MNKFLTGVAIGAVITALLTPKTGRDLQDELISNLNKIQKKIKDFDIKECVTNMEVTTESVKESVQCKLEEAKKAIDEFDWTESKDKIQKKFDEVTERLNEIKEQLVAEDDEDTATSADAEVGV